MSVTNKTYADAVEEISKLQAINAQLLEALRDLVQSCEDMQEETLTPWAIEVSTNMKLARAAIAAAESK